MVPDIPVVAFCFRVRLRLLFVAVVESVGFVLVEVEYFGLFPSKNNFYGFFFYFSEFKIIFEIFTLTFPAFSETVASETSRRSSG